MKPSGFQTIFPLVAAVLIAASIVAATQTHEDMIARARSEYAKHNYKQSLKLAERILASDPTEQDLRYAQRIKGLSMCMLRDQDGYPFAKKIMDEHAPFASDGELWRAMGDDRFARWDRKLAYECFVKAAQLFETEDKDTPAADAWFRAAEALRSRHDILKAQQAAKDWIERRRIGTDEMIGIYEHIVELDVDENRKARALLLAGRATLQEGSWEYAEKGLKRLTRAVEEFSLSHHAVEAQFEKGRFYERFRRFIDAVSAYGQVITQFADPRMAAQAKQRIDDIRGPKLAVMVSGPYAPGSKPELYWQIRNIERIHLRAYPIDLPRALENVVDSSERSVPLLDRLARSKGPLIAEWSFATPDEGKHEYHSYLPESDTKQTTSPIVVPLEGTGAYVVEASGVTRQSVRAASRCLVIISEITALAKCDPDQMVVFVAGSKSGEPVESAGVAVLRYRPRRSIDHAARTTDDAGLAEIELPYRKSFQWAAAVKKDQHQAICAGGNFNWWWWGHRRDYKVYGFTERPVYRPGQTVNFKQILRGHKDGLYTNLPGEKVRVEIFNPKGETIYAKDHVTDEFGALEGSLRIKDDGPLGLYQVRLSIKGRRIGYWEIPGNRFRVEEYKKPEFKVAVEPDKGDYRIGDEMKIRISATYYFGAPVSDAEVNFTVRKQSYTHRYEHPRPWRWYYEELHPVRDYWEMRHRGRFDELVTTATVRTDSSGEALITVKAAPIKDHEDLDLKFLVEASVTDASRRVIRGSGEVKVTHAPFFVYPRPAQAVYGPGDSVEIEIKTEDPNAAPVSGSFDVESWKIQRIAGTIEKGGKTVTEYEEKLLQKVFSKTIEIAETGRGSVRFVPDMTGHFKIIVRQASAPEGQNPVEGSCELWIASRTGSEAHYAYSDLKLIPAADQYEIGEAMRVLVNTSKPGSRVLLTGEADDLLFWLIVHVRENSELVEIPIDESLTPNFTLAAALICDEKIYRDTKKIVVPPTYRFIKVEAATDPGSMGPAAQEDAKKYLPREKTNVRIRLTDMQTGAPVAGQVAVMLVDSSVYYIQPEFRDAIEKAFYGFVRHVGVMSIDSFAGPPALNPHLYHPGWGGRYYRKGAAFAGAMPKDKVAVEPSAAPRSEIAARLEEKEEALVAPVVREQFRDTVLWAGSVVTDGDGVAVIPVTLPDQLTTFALHVISFDKDTRVGQAESELLTTKNIIVRLESGRFFTEGDHSYVTVIAHNYFDEAQDLKIDLTASENLELRKVDLGSQWREYRSGDELDVTIPPSGEVRLDFLSTAVRPGDVELVARARGARESDAIKLTKPVIEWGAKKIASSGGVLSGEGRGEDHWTFTVPEELKRGSQSVTVTLSPSIAAVAMESLPFLARYPYGCVEQTMSRFLPTVVMRKTLQEAGISLDDVRELIAQRSGSDPKLAAKYEFIQQRMRRNPVYSSSEVDSMIAAGLKRLADMQHGDGGWGWWKGGSSDPYMTSYVAYGLSVAKDCDVKLPSGMLERAFKYLLARASEPKREDDRNWWRRHMDNDNTRICMLYVISRLDSTALKSPKLKGHLVRIFAARDELTDYGRAYLALALHAAGMTERACLLVENFDNTAVVDEKTNTAYWGRASGWWYWYHGASETTAWVLQAMMSVSPDDKYLPMGVNWLVHNRRELAWYNTKTTATVVFALARYAKTTGELDCDETFEVVIDDAIRHTVRVTRENLFSFGDRIVVPSEDLAPGEHTIRIARSGSGTLYWGAYLRYFETSERIEPGGHQLAVRRKYFRLVPEEFTNTRKIWKEGEYVSEQFPDIRHNREPLDFGAEITTGELVEVELEIEADHNFEYMVFEDPKPSGCEPYRLTSGASYGGGTYANMELRDTKVAFFATYLPKGKRMLSYKLVCEQPGTFRVLPSFGEAMYCPFVEATGNSGKMTVTVKSAE